MIEINIPNFTLHVFWGKTRCENTAKRIKQLCHRQKEMRLENMVSRIPTVQGGPKRIENQMKHYKTHCKAMKEHAPETTSTPFGEKTLSKPITKKTTSGKNPFKPITLRKKNQQPTPPKHRKNRKLRRSPHLPSYESWELG